MIPEALAQSAASVSLRVMEGSRDRLRDRDPWIACGRAQRLDSKGARGSVIGVAGE